MNHRSEHSPFDNVSTEQALEDHLVAKGLTAPRVTPELVDSKIRGSIYHRFPDTTVTVCLLQLENGFTVVGESACASAENVDEEVGRNIAYRNARDKIWSLEGYVLREKLSAALADLHGGAQ